MLPLSISQDKQGKETDPLPLSVETWTLLAQAPSLVREKTAFHKACLGMHILVQLASSHIVSRLILPIYQQFA